MFKNYLKATLRNLLRYKGFATINIASLTIGIIACLAIGLFVWDELQYDKKIPGAQNIYRIYNERNDNNSITYAACVPPAYTTFLQGQYPEVDNAAVNEVNPNRPKQAMNMARPAKTTIIVCCRRSVLYSSANFSSKKSYSNGYPGAALL